MYGDFILESSPSTFNDSIRAYKVTSVLQHLSCKRIFLGTALASWNRGGPVQEVLSSWVPPGPDIGGSSAKHWQFTPATLMGHVYVLILISFSHSVLQRCGHHAGGHQRWLDDFGHRGHALLERRHAEDQDPGGHLYCQQVHGHAEVNNHKVIKS